MKKILIIEDELPVRANILELLIAEEFNAVATDNGFIGVLWAQENLPDLIICDVMMPDIDGYGVLRQLRQYPLTATIPFIFLTAKADKTDFRQGMELGADDYLTKPFTRNELLGAIATRLAKHELAMQQYNDERQRSEFLQQKFQEIQLYANAKDELLKQLEEELRQAIPRISLVIQMLRNLQSERQQERCLEILQEVCKDEIALLNQTPKLQNFLNSQDLNLLSQLRLVDQEALPT